MAWGLLIMLFLYGLVLQAFNPFVLRPSRLKGEFMAWGLLIRIFLYGVVLQALDPSFLDRLS